MTKLMHLNYKLKPVKRKNEGINDANEDNIPD